MVQILVDTANGVLGGNPAKQIEIFIHIIYYLLNLLLLFILSAD